MKYILDVSPRDFDILKSNLIKYDKCLKDLEYAPTMGPIIEQISKLIMVDSKIIDRHIIEEIRNEYRLACYCMAVKKALNYGQMRPIDRVFKTSINIFKLWGVDFIMYILGTLAVSVGIYVVVALFIPAEYINIFLCYNLVAWLFGIPFNVIHLAIYLHGLVEKKFVNRIINRNLP